MSFWRPVRSYIVMGGASVRTHLHDDTTRHLLIVFAGQAFRLALGLVSSALLARGLGPERLSIFSVLGAAAAVAATLADFGLSNSAVRHIAAEMADPPEQAQRMANSYARLKLLGAVLTAILLIVFAQPLGSILRIPPALVFPLVIAGALWLLATALSGITSTVLRALRRFRALVTVQSAIITLTVLLTGLLFVTGRLTILSAFVVGILAALLGASVGFRLLPHDWRRALLVRGALLTPEGRRLLTFSRWLAVSALLSVLLSQLDLLVLNRWAPPALVGFYAVAVNLAFKVDIINQTLHTVLLPSVSALSGAAAYRHHVRRSLLRSGLLALAIVAFLPLVRPFILTVYGGTYAPSVGLFYALMAVVLFDLLTIPFLLLAFPLNLPQFIVVSDVAGLVTLLVASGLLVPLWGVYGIVAAKLAAKVVRALVTGSVILRRLRRVDDMLPAA